MTMWLIHKELQMCHVARTVNFPESISENWNLIFTHTTSPKTSLEANKRLTHFLFIQDSFLMCRINVTVSLLISQQLTYVFIPLLTMNFLCSGLFLVVLFIKWINHICRERKRDELGVKLLDCNCSVSRCCCLLLSSLRGERLPGRNV